MLIFGAHVSTAKGLPAALDYAASVGCECLQLFAKSPRQWRASHIDTGAAEVFRSMRADRGFGPVFTHTAYLINLATDNEDLRRKSIIALTDELTRASILGADGVVTHLGNDPAGDPAAAASRVADSVHAAYSALSPGVPAVRLLLENTAGAGRTFGSSFEELGVVIEAADLPAETLGVCFDTCHGFAWGYDLATPGGWEVTVESLSTHVGVDRLGLIHANDCMFERGSRKDRHAWIGRGLIGRDGFTAMVAHKELAGVPVVTEMPGDIPEKDSINIETLKSMRDGRN